MLYAPTSAMHSTSARQWVRKILARSPRAVVSTAVAASETWTLESSSFRYAGVSSSRSRR